jgi:hypothetical protein
VAQTGSLTCKMLRGRTSLSVTREAGGWEWCIMELGWDLRARIEFHVARQSHWRCITVRIMVRIVVEGA